MRFSKATIRILVRKDYGTCFDFYTIQKKIGLVAVWGDRNGPYTSFAVKEGVPPCFAIFAGANMTMFNGYERPQVNTQPDVAVIPSDDLNKDYQRLKEAGVRFLSEPQLIEDWGMRCTYFRDPEGNLFELNDA